MKSQNARIAGRQEDNSAQSTLVRREQTSSNVHVRIKEDEQRLLDIQKKLNMSAFRKTEHPIANEFKDLDLKKHKLLLEDFLIWRNVGRKLEFINVHILLLEDLIILLQKENEELILKFYNHYDTESLISPILRVSETRVRANAIDTRAFYLIDVSNNSNIYEFVAASKEKRRIWFQHLSKAVEDCKDHMCASHVMEHPTEASTSGDDSDKNPTASLSAELERTWIIQEMLDMSAFQRMEHPIVDEFKDLNLTRHKLLFEGSLKWRIHSTKDFIKVHVLLLEDFIILLQKKNEKFILMFYNNYAKDLLLSPILRVSKTLVRLNAVDSKAFYLIDVSNDSHIYEFVAMFKEECRIWFEHISKAVDQCKERLYASQDAKT